MLSTEICENEFYFKREYTITDFYCYLLPTHGTQEHIWAGISQSSTPGWPLLLFGTTKQQQEVQMSLETCEVSISTNSSAQVHSSRQGNPFAFLCRSAFLVKLHIGENNCCDLLDSYYKDTVVSLGSCGSTATLHPPSPLSSTACTTEEPGKAEAVIYGETSRGPLRELHVQTTMRAAYPIFSCSSPLDRTSLRFPSIFSPAFLAELLTHSLFTLLSFSHGMSSCPALTSSLSSFPFLYYISPCRHRSSAKVLTLFIPYGY